ncbi:MAG: hypothetical protein FWD68_13370 [Alphaproteobacteria bacterium]|nr:hypothetical protein [Alphaproteobacteria bacterium]
MAVTPATNASANQGMDGVDMNSLTSQQNSTLDQMKELTQNQAQFTAAMNCAKQELAAAKAATVSV